MPEKRETIQENPRIISDQELDEVRRTQNHPASYFKYIDLLDNLSQAKRDSEFVTGRANVDEIKNRITVLEAYVNDHPESRIIKAEKERNYKEGMSFSDLQKQFINDLGLQSGYQSSHDYAEYIAAKKRAEEFSDMKVSQYGKTSLPPEYQEMTIGEAFKIIFPRDEVDVDEMIPS